MEKVINDAKTKMEKSIEALKREFATIRTGRANASILDRVKADYYGASTPLNHMASISIPDPRQIVVRPFEKQFLGEIEKAIVEANLGLNPTNDGKVIRIKIPPLNEQRRKELVKFTKKAGEDGKISIRNIRREANNLIKKNEEISEDLQNDYEQEIQEITNKFISKIDDMLDGKEKEIMEV